MFLFARQISRDIPRHDPFIPRRVVLQDVIACFVRSHSFLLAPSSHSPHTVAIEVQNDSADRRARRHLERYMSDPTPQIFELVLRDPSHSRSPPSKVSPRGLLRCLCRPREALYPAWMFCELLNVSAARSMSPCGGINSVVWLGRRGLTRSLSWVDNVLGGDLGVERHVFGQRLLWRRATAYR